MCKGLAVIVEKINDEWVVYAKENEKSHDELLHTLDEDLRDGKRHHLKFEVYFPMIIHDDIQQDVARDGAYYPLAWIEERMGKWVACPESFSAVAKHLSENPDLLNFDPTLLDNASLNRASLNRASLNGASLNGASLNDASLNRASLNRASLNGASLNRASLNGASLNDASLNGASLNDALLNGASLNGASLNGASLNDASLRKKELITFWAELKVAVFDKLYIDFELKTRKEIEQMVSDESKGDA